MSLTLVLWLFAFLVLMGLSVIRPVWGVSLYMLTFFASPPFWWWGDPIKTIRWNLYGGILLLAAVLLSGVTRPRRLPFTRGAKTLFVLGGLMLANATVVHVALAPNLSVSGEPYTMLAKFVLLFILITLAVRDRTDFRILLFSLLVGASYIGYETTINDRGDIVGNRLEGVGAPNATHANELASLMMTVLPLSGAALLMRGWKGRLVAIVAGPLIANVVLLCNSRGAFLSAIAAAPALLVFSPPHIRRHAVKILALGAVAVWILMGDARIIDRFVTTFASDETRDASAAGRLEYWSAGLEVIADHPLGSGGNGFKRVHGPRYLSKKGLDFEARSVHNGYINEACEWGIQGLALRLTFFVVTAIVLIGVARRAARQGESDDALAAATLLASLTAFLVTCLFGDRLDAEWGYWLAAAAAALDRLTRDHSASNIEGVASPSRTTVTNGPPAARRFGNPAVAAN